MGISFKIDNEGDWFNGFVWLKTVSTFYGGLRLQMMVVLFF